MSEPAKNLYPIPQSPDLMNKISPVVEEARSLVVVTSEDVDLARSKGKIINALISEVTATFKPIKQAQDAAKKVTLEQEKKHLEPLEQAKGIIAGKISEWDRQERERIAEEQRKLAAAEEKKRQAALEAARKKLESLTEKLTSDQERFSALESRLNEPDISDEEAGLIRTQISTIQARINTTVERSQEVEMKVEEAAAPIAPQVDVSKVKTATGVKQEKVITNINTKVLLRYLSSEGCILDATLLIKWNEPALKREIQTKYIPGVSWKYEEKVRF